MNSTNKLIEMISSFFAVGVISTLADWAVFFVLYKLISWPYWLALFPAFLAGAIINFHLNKTRTFKNSSSKKSQAIVFFIIAAATFLLSQLFMYYLIKVMDGLLARVLTTGIIFIMNFILHSTITFGKLYKDNQAKDDVMSRADELLFKTKKR
jgi:putative flippase GtrA